LRSSTRPPASRTCCTLPCSVKREVRKADEKTLQPTYRLLLGLAGASSGIEIAHRFGINGEVISHARENLDVSAQDAEAYLQKLQTESTQAEDLRKALEEGLKDKSKMIQVPEFAELRETDEFKQLLSLEPRVL